MRGTKTGIKDLKPGDVIRAFDGPWNRAIVVNVYKADIANPTNYWLADMWRPHMHMNSVGGWDNQPSIQFEIYTISGPSVSVLESGGIRQ